MSSYVLAHVWSRTGGDARLLTQADKNKKMYPHPFSEPQG